MSVRSPVRPQRKQGNFSHTAGVFCMSLIAMVFGVFLMLLGGCLYVQSDPRAATALIPAYFGIALFVLGVLARSEKLRMHVMHVAALLGLIGFAMPAFMVIKGLAIDGKEFGLSMQGQA